MASVGQLHEIGLIPVRERAPSPARELETGSKAPPLARDMNIMHNLHNIDVIHAEDDEVFREMALTEFLKAGFKRENIHQADNGLGGLEHLARLQLQGNLMMPLMVVLDVRMPGMDGRECALQIQELVKKRLLRREPFVICVSSIHRQIIVDEGQGNFQLVLPKPFVASHVTTSLEYLGRWWCMGMGRALPAWKSFEPGLLDIIAADDEPVCRMSSYTAFLGSGIQMGHVTEVDTEEELTAALAEKMHSEPQRPLLLLLGQPPWAMAVRRIVEANKGASQREPFVICTSVDSDKFSTSTAVHNFHAFLPNKFNSNDVKWCLELCRLWWLSRGDGPKGADDDSGSEAAPSDSD